MAQELTGRSRHAVSAPIATISKARPIGHRLSNRPSNAHSTIKAVGSSSIVSTLSMMNISLRPFQGVQKL